CVATVILKRHSNAWKGRLTMTAVSDEVMFGERGTVFLLRERPDVAGDFLISGEGPGFMHLAVAEKGLLWLDVEARSAGGHASRALRGETAVIKLPAFLACVRAMNGMYATLPRELAGVSGGEGNLGLRLSLNAGTLLAGTVRSQVATSARTQIDIRLPPGISAQACETMIREQTDGEDIGIAVVKAWDANWTALDNPLVVELASSAATVRRRPGAAPRRLPAGCVRRAEFPAAGATSASPPSVMVRSRRCQPASTIT